MGNFDGAEVCQLVRLFILNDLVNKYGTKSDSSRTTNSPFLRTPQEKIRKQITKRFKENGLKITIQCNLKSADYLGATLNLTNVRFQPYRKLNDEPPYTKSNHPPTVQSIQSHQSQIIIQQRNIRPLYDKALRSSGFNESLHSCKTQRKNTSAPTKRIEQETSSGLTLHAATSLKHSST